MHDKVPRRVRATPLVWQGGGAWAEPEVRTLELRAQTQARPFSPAFVTRDSIVRFIAYEYMEKIPRQTDTESPRGVSLDQGSAAFLGSRLDLVQPERWRPTIDEFSFAMYVLY